MKVYILTSTGMSENNTQIEGVFFNLKDAQEQMRKLYESSKKFWENYCEENNCKLSDRYEDVNIEIGNI